MSDGRREDGPAATGPGGSGGPEAPPPLPGGPRDQIGFDDLPPALPRPVVPASAGGDAAGPPPPKAPDRPAGDDRPASREPGQMGLLDHLEELRKVLFQSVAAMAVAALLCWFKAGELLDLILRPLGAQGAYFMSPSGAFMARVKVAFAVGLFLVAPFVLFRIYGFVLPGLHRKERRVTTPVLVWTVLLFYTGSALAYLGFPYMLKVMIAMGTESMKPMIEVGSYLSTFLQFVLCCGLVFELPMVILALCAAGIVRPQWLLAKWRHVLVIVAVVAAAITPDANVINQLIMMVPVLALYVGSVVVALVVVGRKDRREAAARAAEGD